MALWFISDMKHFRICCYRNIINYWVLTRHILPIDDYFSITASLAVFYLLLSAMNWLLNCN